MKTLTSLLLLLALVLGCDDGPPEPPPPSKDPNAGLQRVTGTPKTSSEGTELRSDTETPALGPEVFDLDQGLIERDPGSGADGPPPTAPEESPVADRGIEIEPIDSESGEPIGRFRFVRTDARGIRIGEQEEADGIGFVELDDEKQIHIVVEAEGYTPTDAIALELAPGEPGRRLRIEMLSAAARSGVELTIWKPDTSAATAIQVRLERRDLTAAFDAPMSLVWERSAGHPEGVYRFPDLRPGHYRAEIQAIDERGEPALLLPHTFEFDFEGVSLFQQTVILNPAGQILLTILDPTSRQPIGNRDVNVWLSNTLGEELPVLWVVREGNRLLAGDGTLPRASACRLKTPIAPGTYTLRVRRRVDRSDDRSELQDLEIPIAVLPGNVTEHTVR